MFLRAEWIRWSLPSSFQPVIRARASNSVENNASFKNSAGPYLPGRRPWTAGHGLRRGRWHDFEERRHLRATRPCPRRPPEICWRRSQGFSRHQRAALPPRREECQSTSAERFRGAGTGKLQTLLTLSGTSLSGDESAYKLLKYCVFTSIAKHVKAFRLIHGVVHYLTEPKPGFLWSNLTKSTDGLTVMTIEAMSEFSFSIRCSSRNSQNSTACRQANFMPIMSAG